MNPSPSGDPAASIAPTGVISTARPLPGEPPQSPPANRRLLPSILVASLSLFATYGALISVFLPTQVALLDEANKVGNLAVVTTVSFVFTLFVQPIVGALSDRTRSRLGRRAPWMAGGALVGGICLLAMGSFGSLVWITIFWVVIQVSLNAFQGPLSAITPDRFPRERRGAASAMSGLGSQVGMTVGVMAAGSLAANIGVGYAVFGVLVIVVALLFVVVNRDWSSRESAVEPWSWRGFLRGFWIDPRQNPDFAWAFSARFLFILGYFVVTAFQLYILTDYVGLGLGEAQGAVGMLALAALLPTLAAILLSGWWSDRIGRRKPFIYVASGVMAAALAIPLVMPTLTGMILMSVVNGIGFGLYMSCDTALMTEVLTGGGAAAGKDLGILNVATNIPQAMSPAIAGVIISAFGGYPTLFVFGIVAVVLAAVTLVPIRSVR